MSLRRRLDLPRVVAGSLVACVALGSPRVAAADWEISFYGGASLPSYEQRFTFAIPPGVSTPGVDVRPSGDFVLDASGGPVFGGALAWELAGFFAIEGRVDTATVSLDAGSVRLDVSAQLPPPIGPVRGAVTLGPGAIDLKRLVVLSINGRIRTPGSLSIYASGGLSYLPGIEATSAIPVSVDVAGLPALPGASVGLRLVAAPGQAGYSLGMNAGGGVRLKLPGPLALFGEGRIFAFQDFELTFELENGGPLQGFDALIQQAEPVRFTPVYFQAAAGLAISF